MFWFSLFLLLLTGLALLGVLFNWEFCKKEWQKGKPYQTHDSIMAMILFLFALALFIYACVYG